MAETPPSVILERGAAGRWEFHAEPLDVDDFNSPSDEEITKQKRAAGTKAGRRTLI